MASQMGVCICTCVAPSSARGVVSSAPGKEGRWVPQGFPLLNMCKLSPFKAGFHFLLTFFLVFFISVVGIAIFPIMQVQM